MSQAELLRAGRLGEADVENIAEEIESLGRSEKRELLSRCNVLLTHLLKWQFQPVLQSRSCESTIREQRARLVEHLDDNPSLKSQLPEIILSAYKQARVEASIQTGLLESTFADRCPSSSEEILTEGFWPRV